MPKGPSLAPGDKRLAVQTEDHPLDYRDFEGTIPEGQYGGGTVIVWDRGTWKPIGDPDEGLEKGRLDFELDGEKLRGRFILVRTTKGRDAKKPSWLLMKRSDAYARTGSEADVVDAQPASVLTGRTIEDVRAGVPAIARERTARARAGARPSPTQARDGPRRSSRASRAATRGSRGGAASVRLRRAPARHAREGRAEIRAVDLRDQVRRLPRARLARRRRRPHRVPARPRLDRPVPRDRRRALACAREDGDLRRRGRLRAPGRPHRLPEAAERPRQRRADRNGRGSSTSSSISSSTTAPISAPNRSSFARTRCAPSSPERRRPS